MKKLFLILGATLYWVSALHAQEEAYFETTLYFEDAVGNKDTIVIGYDPDAQFEVDEFDGAVLQTPFDSVFDVRASSVYEYFPTQPVVTLRKRVVDKALRYSQAVECYTFSTGMVFVIRVKYPPVNVSWDSVAFRDNFCHVGSMILPSFTALSHDSNNPWWVDFPDEANEAGCLASSNSWSVELPHPDGYSLLKYPYVLDSVVGMGVDTIPMLLFSFMLEGNGFTPCQERVTQTNESSTIHSPARTIWPNPTNAVLYFGDRAEWYTVQDINGRLLNSGMGSEIDVSSFSRGVYFLRVGNESARPFMVID